MNSSLLKKSLAIAATLAALMNNAQAGAPTSAWPVVYPYNLVGKLTYVFSTGSGALNRGSGFVAKGSSIATSAYNVYDAQLGWAKSHTFYLGYDNGSYTSRTTGRYTYALSGYVNAAKSAGTWSNQALSADAGGIVLWSAPAGGRYLGYTASGAGLVRSTTTSKMLLGYGYENGHTGNSMLAASTTRWSAIVYGNLYRSTDMGAEAGMFGGPALVRSGSTWVVAGIIVGREFVGSSGALIRATDGNVALLINSYLR